jgi:hypothetical protein
LKLELQPFRADDEVAAAASSRTFAELVTADLFADIDPKRECFLNSASATPSVRVA